MDSNKTKRTTLKDIAKEAGVSTATVSYVLNYSQKESISHDTRLKVFAAAMKLKYVPNMSAKTSSGKRSMLAGIIISMGEHDKKSKLYQYYDLIREMQRLLNELAYDVFLITTKEMEQDRNISKRRRLDAVFVIDTREDVFKAIARQYFVPVIFIDGYVKAPCFWKILTNPNDILDKANKQLGNEFYVVMEDYSNKSLLTGILERVDEQDVFINRFDNDLVAFLQAHKDQEGLVIGEFLGMQVEKHVDNRNISVVVYSDYDIMLQPDTKTIVISNKQKAKKAVEVMEKLIHFEYPNGVDETVYVDIQ